MLLRQFFAVHILQSPRWKFITIVLGIALVLRLTMFVTFGVPPNNKLYEQGGIAENIYNGHGFSYHAWYIYTSLQPERRTIMSAAPQFFSANQPPLYPYLIAGVYQFAGQTHTARIFLILLDCLLGTISVFLVYRIVLDASFLTSSDIINHQVVQYNHNDIAARCAAITAACFLPGAHAVIKILAVVPSIFAALCSLWAMVWAARECSFRSSILVGASFGVTMLMRSEVMLLFAVVFGILTFYHYRQQRSKAIRWGIVAICACAVIVAPWTYRNYKLFDRFMPVISRPWHEIWRGNNTMFIGSLYRLADSDKEEFLSGCDTIRNRQMMARLDSLPYDQTFEARADDIYKEEALTYMRTHPIKTAQMTLLKAAEIWTFDFYYSKARDPFYILCVLPWTCCAAIGLALFWRRHHTLTFPALFWCFACVYAYYTAIFSITFYMVRYQVYFVSLLFPFSGLGLWWLFTRFYQMNKRQ